MGATAPPPSLPPTQRGVVGAVTPRRGPGPRRTAARQPDPGQARRPSGPPRGRATPAAGAEMNRETRMANRVSDVGAAPRPTPGPSDRAEKHVSGGDAPAGGFVQLLTPDGERIDSVTTAD